jgi:hypothetical protein
LAAAAIIIVFVHGNATAQFRRFLFGEGFLVIVGLVSTDRFLTATHHQIPYVLPQGIHRYVMWLSRIYGSPDGVSKQGQGTLK